MEESKKSVLVLSNFSKESAEETTLVIIRSFLNPANDWKKRLQTDFNCKFHLQVFLYGLFTNYASESIMILESWLLSKENLVSKEQFNNYISLFFAVLPSVFTSSNTGKNSKDTNISIDTFVNKVFNVSSNENTEFSKETWNEALHSCLNILACKASSTHRKNYSNLFAEYFLKSKIEEKDVDEFIHNFAQTCFSSGTPDIFRSWKKIVRNTMEVFFSFPKDEKRKKFVAKVLSLIYECSLTTKICEEFCREEGALRTIFHAAVECIKHKINNKESIFQKTFHVEPIFELFPDAIFISTFPDFLNMNELVSDLCWITSYGSFSRGSKWEEAVKKYIEFIIKQNNPRFFNAVINSISEVLAYRPQFSSIVLELEKSSYYIPTDNSLGDWVATYTNLIYNNKDSLAVKRFVYAVPSVKYCEENFFFQRLLYLVFVDSVVLFDIQFMFFEENFKNWIANSSADVMTKHVLLLGISTSCGFSYKSAFIKTILEGIYNISKNSTDLLVAASLSLIECSNNVPKMYNEYTFLTAFYNLLEQKGNESFFFTLIKNIIQMRPVSPEAIKNIAEGSIRIYDYAIGSSILMTFYEKKEETVLVLRTLAGITVFHIAELVPPVKEVLESSMKESILRKNVLELEKKLEPFKPFSQEEEKKPKSAAITFLSNMCAVEKLKKLDNAIYCTFDAFCSKISYNISFVQLVDNKENCLVEGETQAFDDFNETFSNVCSSQFVEFNLVPRLDSSSIATVVFAEKLPNFNYEVEKLNEKLLFYIVPLNGLYKVVTKNWEFLETSVISKPRILQPFNAAKLITIFSYLAITDARSPLCTNGILHSRLVDDISKQGEGRKKAIIDIIGAPSQNLLDNNSNLF